MASYWELSLKISKGKLAVPTGWQAWVRRTMESEGIEWLAVGPEHCDLVSTLPPLHGDPFDRMLVAQAEREGLTLVTNDSVLRDYGVPVLW